MADRRKEIRTKTGVCKRCNQPTKFWNIIPMWGVIWQREYHMDNTRAGKECKNE